MRTPPLGTGGPGRSRTKYSTTRLPQHSTPRPPQPPTRRQRVTALASRPYRDWTGRKLAGHLQVKPHNMLTQLAE
jgi:hypothetical protein